MLERQITEIEGGSIKEGVEAIARQVMTLAQVYDHLLGSDMSRSIEFGAYLQRCAAASRTFSSPSP